MKRKLASDFNGGGAPVFIFSFTGREGCRVRDDA